MWSRVLTPLLALVLAMIVAGTSIGSAGAMAPDRGDAQLELYQLASGLSSGDLCGDGPGKGHPCPFCHALPKAPTIGHAGIALRMTPHDGWRQRADLWRKAQARNLHHSPRAPPVPA